MSLIFLASSDPELYVRNRFLLYILKLLVFDGSKGTNYIVSMGGRLCVSLDAFAHLCERGVNCKSTLWLFA